MAKKHDRILQQAASGSGVIVTAQLLSAFEHKSATVQVQGDTIVINAGNNKATLPNIGDKFNLGSLGQNATGLRRTAQAALENG